VILVYKYAEQQSCFESANQAITYLWSLD